MFSAEVRRLAFSMLYSMFVMLVTAFTMVVVHQRTPDQKNYPPLPDLILDNVQFMPYAFVLAEICILTLVAITIIIVIFHKHRLIILRRLFAISGTVFLLRCLTMSMTSLSVPSKHLQCNVEDWDTSFQARLAKASDIVLGLGMSINNVRSCGDYMFSGHTTALTLFNYLINDYTNFGQLHIIGWLLNAFGMFFILLAHEHYSIDVIIAFYVSSRMWMYYHTLSSTFYLQDSDQLQISMWRYPMFSYLESHQRGAVVNEFEIPFFGKKPSKNKKYNKKKKRT